MEEEKEGKDESKCRQACTRDDQRLEDFLTDAFFCDLPLFL